MSLAQLTPASSDSIQIAWQSLDQNISSGILDHYGYIVQYRQLGEVSWIAQDVPAEGNSNEYAYHIDGRQGNSVYEVRVSPYRQIGGRREMGQPTDILYVVTACTGKGK